jgi:hypothetical protein
MHLDVQLSRLTRVSSKIPRPDVPTTRSQIRLHDYNDATMKLLTMSLTLAIFGRSTTSRGIGKWCNRVRDRYEEKVAHTLAQPPQCSLCGRQLCKQHERSNMWYQRELIKNTYSTSAYAGSTARKNLPRFIVYHSDVMWPYYNGPGTPVDWWIFKVKEKAEGLCITNVLGFVLIIHHPSYPKMLSLHPFLH